MEPPRVARHASRRSERSPRRAACRHVQPLQRSHRARPQRSALVRVVADADMARLFVFGVGMRTHTGVARRMFGALAQCAINISMINTSEVCVSVVVNRERGEEALAALKMAFNVT